MSLKNRVSLLLIVDSLIVFFSIFVGYYLLHPYTDVLQNKFLLASALTIFIAHHALAMYYGLYRKVWEYASIGELTSIFKAVSWSIVVIGLVQYLYRGDVLLRALAITWMLHLILIGGSRLSWRLLRDKKIRHNDSELKRTLIIGAGKAGTLVARQLLANPENGLLPVLYVDDDKNKQGLDIYGVRVVHGNTKDIANIALDNKIDTIIIAIPSLGKQETAELIKTCMDSGVRTQTIPLIEDIMTGKVSVTDIQDVKIEDLLGRDEVKLDMNKIADQLTSKTILVTGAGGSIGSEISRQIARFGPKKLLLLGHGENSIYLIDMELRQTMAPDTEIIPIIADVQDRERILDIMDTYKPDVVYHAAAHKHVPLMEGNPMEAVKNNVYGTKNVAEAAHMSGVGNFVMVSTDKAVNPPNVMGATKRFAEMIVQNLAKRSDTKFAAVRFGNVLGSRGSVIPLFKKQIAAGGPVTVTDPRMTRYFMTIPEASRLVIQAGTLAEGGEVFVLDMGEPVKIVDLAQNLIRLSGYAEGEIGINFSGIRPGEKLFEELLNDNEIQTEQIFPKIYIGKANPVSEGELTYLLEKLPDMRNDEVKDVLVSLANRKNIDMKDKELLNVSN
ncbi:Capsular polysaccharide biosynthesis protein capD [Planococcus antarcticus DSM 14505]|uniref:Capsular polysaccharide biosynthesis protein capD n=1 Tax=Planococcus antarcticus DSM 14505 TaxID=1185653 RepID=A0AA87IJ55_9BACL|nr:nucleoside-diphosphate sugar epimerase/dehydratase [Planococcus antarcticus]EIM05706.1 Capsular polysaccharide biosynthesis protein capD [Planococcus antarcticus DSM 14505]